MHVDLLHQYKDNDSIEIFLLDYAEKILKCKDDIYNIENLSEIFFTQFLLKEYLLDVNTRKNSLVNLERIKEITNKVIRVYFEYDTDNFDFKYKYIQKLKIVMISHGTLVFGVNAMMFYIETNNDFIATSVFISLMKLSDNRKFAANQNNTEQLSYNEACSILNNYFFFSLNDMLNNFLKDGFIKINDNAANTNLITKSLLKEDVSIITDKYNSAVKKFQKEIAEKMIIISKVYNKEHAINNIIYRK